MIIIGERINGAIPKTAEAINTRNESYIVDLVQSQEQGGADYIDVCAGTATDIEYETLCWLIDLVQGVASKPICIDSPDPDIIGRVLPKLTKPGIINSVSMEGKKCEILFPLLQDNPEWQAIALCCDNNGIAGNLEDKVRIADSLIEIAAKYDISPDRLHVDPVVLALATANRSAVEFCGAMTQIKARHPSVNVTAAISNISFGMPCRGLLNASFLTLAISAGLDSAITDPSNRRVSESIIAIEALMGNDRHCRNYNKAYRAGKLR